MSKPKKFAKIGFGCLLVVVIALSLAYFGLTRLVYRISGEPFSDNARDHEKLQRIAEPYDSVIVAIERHRASHGNYPEDLNDLDASIEGIQQVKSLLGRQSHSVYYHAKGGEFMFHVKLNWDGGLNFQSRSGHWRYDPGNGDPDWPIY